MRQVSEGEHTGPGTVVGGRYQLRAAVGNGGMGTVWQATDTQLGRAVAVKEVVPPSNIAPEDRDAMYQRMMREARAAAGLSHPGIVQVYDVVTDGGRPWVVMELLDARSLADMVLQDGALAPRAVAKIGLSLLGALEVAHAAGVLHRDVKPANVLVCADGRCVLTDFGVARMPTDQQLTTPGMVLGSPHFISPERAMGARFGPPSDLFSLGVTLYVAVEGRPPFDKGDPISTMHAVVEDQPPPPERAGPLTELLHGLLEKDPARRWDAPSARRVLRELLAGPLASSPGLFPTDPYSVVPTQRQPWQERAASQIGGRAMLRPGESLTDRLEAARGPGGAPTTGRPAPADGPTGSAADERTGAHPRPVAGRDREPYRPGRGPAHDDDPAATGPMPAVPGPTGRADHPTDHRPTGTRTGPRHGGRRRADAAGRADGDRWPFGGAGAGPGRTGTVRDRAANVVGRARVVARQTAQVAGRASVQGWQTLRRAPRQTQLTVAGGAAAVLLLGLVLIVTLGGDDGEGTGPAVPVGQAPTGAAGAGDQPLIDVREYAGRGVVVNLPAGWEGLDDPDLTYVNFSDPADASVQIRLVVDDPWSADARALVETAESNISSSNGCAEPYQRVGLGEAELAGRPAALLEYTCGQGGETRRAKWITVVHEQVAYSLRLSAPESRFAEHQVVFDELVRSFRITG